MAHIGEADARRLYAREASPSMFAYCTERLHLSDAEAYLRIAAARASREHPVLLEMLADGRLHLTAIAKLAPHLTPENKDALLQRATHKSKRQIEELIAEIAPRPDAPALVRKLPERRAVTPLAAALKLDADHATPEAPGASLAPDGEASTDSEPAAGAPVRQVQLRPDAVAASRPAVIEPLAPARYKIQFTASAELRDKLERLRGLMRGLRPRRRPRRRHRAGGHREAREARSATLRADQSREGLPAGNRAFAAAAAGPLPRSQSSASKGDGPAVTGRDPAAPAVARRPAASRHIPGRGAARRVRARRGPVPLRGRAGPTMHRARGARVPPSAPVRLRRRPRRGRDLPGVQGPQPVPCRGRLRAGGHRQASAIADRIADLASADLIRDPAHGPDRG